MEPRQGNWNGDGRWLCGNIMACRCFPERAGREFIGCGCFHKTAEPCHPEILLEEADRVLVTCWEHGHIA